MWPAGRRRPSTVSTPWLAYRDTPPDLFGNIPAISLYTQLCSVARNAATPHSKIAPQAPSAMIEKPKLTNSAAGIAMLMVTPSHQRSTFCKWAV